MFQCQNIPLGVPLTDHSLDPMDISKRVMRKLIRTANQGIIKRRMQRRKHEDIRAPDTPASPLEASLASLSCRRTNPPARLGHTRKAQDRESAACSANTPTCTASYRRNKILSVGSQFKTFITRYFSRYRFVTDTSVVGYKRASSPKRPPPSLSATAATAPIYIFHSGHGLRKYSVDFFCDAGLRNICFPTLQQ